MKSGIYLIQNTIDEKAYVGSSKKMWDRWRNHRSDLRAGRHINTHLQNAWNRDGEEAFMFLVLESCPVESLLEREEWWITFFDSLNPDRGYNLWSARRHECAPETREKIRALQTGRIFTEEHRRNISVARMGMKFSPEHIANNAAVRRGRKQTPEHVAKSVAARIGRKCSEETKHRMSLSIKAVMTPEVREKIAASQRGRRGHIPWNKGKKLDQPAWNKGISMSPESRARLSTAKMGQKAWNKGVRHDNCQKGHPFSGQNLMVLPNGERRCRECMNENARRYREANRLKTTAFVAEEG